MTYKENLKDFETEAPKVIDKFEYAKMLPHLQRTFEWEYLQRNLQSNCSTPREKTTTERARLPWIPPLTSYPSWRKTWTTHRKEVGQIPRAEITKKDQEKEARSATMHKLKRFLASIARRHHEAENYWWTKNGKNTPPSKKDRKTWQQKQTRNQNSHHNPYKGWIERPPDHINSIWRISRWTTI